MTEQTEQQAGGEEEDWQRLKRQRDEIAKLIAEYGERARMNGFEGHALMQHRAMLSKAIAATCARHREESKAPAAAATEAA